MENKEEYRKNLEAQLKEWKAKIDDLEARGAKFTSETKNRLDEGDQGTSTEKGDRKGEMERTAEGKRRILGHYDGGSGKSRGRIKRRSGSCIARFK